MQLWYLSHCLATRAQASQLARAFAACINKVWMLIKIQTKIRPLATLDTSAQSFIGGFCAHAISTKILCASPYVFIITKMSLNVSVPLDV